MRNDGYYTVVDITGTGPYVIQVDRTLRDEDIGRTTYFFYINYPQGLEQIVNSMIIYDVYDRTKVQGLKSERIGTYSYTMGDVSASGYPADITSALMGYKKPKVIQ